MIVMQSVGVMHGFSFPLSIASRACIYMPSNSSSTLFIAVMFTVVSAACPDGWTASPEGRCYRVSDGNAYQWELCQDGSCAEKCGAGRASHAF